MSLVRFTTSLKDELTELLLTPQIRLLTVKALPIFLKQGFRWKRILVFTFDRTQGHIEFSVLILQDCIYHIFTNFKTKSHIVKKFPQYSVIASQPPTNNHDA